MVELKINLDKINDFVIKTSIVQSVDYVAYDFHRRHIVKDSRGLEKELKEKDLDEVSAYLIGVAAAADMLFNTFYTLSKKSFSKDKLNYDDAQSYYFTLANLARLHETGTGLAEKYRGRMDEDAQKKFSGILNSIESEINQANKIFGYDSTNRTLSQTS
jgi:hypothetical protein